MRSVAQTFPGEFRMLEAHACSVPRYCKTCFAGHLIKKSGTGKGNSEDSVGHSQFRDGVNVTDV